MNLGCRPARRLLSRGPVCAIEECSCGTLHVSIGVLTLRLEPEVVASIWETLGDALARLSATRPSTTAPPPHPSTRPPERPS
jgi:hypothetical protein